MYVSLLILNCFKMFFFFFEALREVIIYFFFFNGKSSRLRAIPTEWFLRGGRGKKTNTVTEEQGRRLTGSIKLISKQKRSRQSAANETRLIV